MRPLKFGVGQPHVRVEDPTLLTGRGRFVADTVPADALHAVMGRSPHAHAHFRIKNLPALRPRPGVRLVLTAQDIADLGAMPCEGAVEPKGEQEMWVPKFPVLASDVVRHVGDAVVFVVADTLEAAKDAVEAIEIEWQPLPAVADLRAAVAPGAPLVWNERPGNSAYLCEFGDEAVAARAFAAAARTVKIELVNNRVVTNYLETRGVVAEFDLATGRTTLTLASQGSHTIRDALADSVLKIPRERLRVVTGDVGGGFGTKTAPYREYALAAVAAERLQRPVAWVADRQEHFLADSQGRDHFTVAEMALDADGRFLALRVDTLANMGAYLAFYAPFIPWIGATMLPGVYRIPAMFARVSGIYTHTVPVDAYRGAGRPEAAYVIERLVDACAREIGVAPDELRRKNFIRSSDMPYKTATQRTYDTGDFAGHLARAQAIARWKEFPVRARAAEKRGRVCGIGVACYIEACGGISGEPARINIECDGSATLHIGTQSNGQGHATAYAQFAAEALDLPLEKIRTVQGDTDDLPEGGGTGGSRSIPAGGPGVAGAARKLANQLIQLAADELETSADKLEIVDGAVRVIGSNRLVTFAALAAKPGVPPDALVAEDAVKPKAATYPNGTHICEVEIDPDTGTVEIVGYFVVDDFGVTINPLLLEGQIHGGVAQGIGQAISERTVYDEAGQLLTASFMDYALPRAGDLPFLRFETRNIPSKHNALGIKGAGEAGAVGACPAVMNAVNDALHRGFGAAHLDMPATPERVWRAIAEARRR